ncbi:ABC transporter substrate-binding protein [Gryllotalpicola ginsengisoli]|uniref:ABC transporter substrate-binding protein n=1 Tax=Gryllotalpicola ginsengisoli TaxID=444608 RepID=UPI0003B42F45|nr:ABC transporter substrate-binding protein [Gryllotalpicola ginsengisoli]
MTMKFLGRRGRIATAAAAAAVAAALALAGCSGTASTGGRTTITFSYLWTGKEADALKQVVADFNKSQSKITVKAVSNPDQTKQLSSMSSANGSFDVSDSFGSNVGAWASKGILEPLDDYSFDTSDFIPSVLKQDKYKGKLYAMPIAVQEYKLIYNKAEFAAAGITSPPTTMDELAQDAAKLTKQSSDGTITQLGLGTSSAYNLLSTLAYVFGGKWDTNGKPSPTDAGNIAALNWYKTNVLDKYGASNIAKFESGYGEYMTAQDPFYTGKIAMTLDGEWQSANIAKVAPNLKWGVADIPTAVPGLENATQTYSSMFFIPANSKHKQEAATFIKYLTGKKAMLSFTKALGNLPARTSLLDDSSYDSLPGFSVWLQGLKSKNAFSFAPATYTTQYQADLTSAFSSFVLGKESAEEAMKSVASKAASYDQ